MWRYFLAGGPMMWPLLACSILALAIILERGWFWRRLSQAGDEKDARELLRSIGTGGRSNFAKPAGVITAMLQKGIEAGPGNCVKAMEISALASLGRMRQGMNILETVITASPMLGIMGTVLGIISAFDMLGDAGVDDPKAVIAGIAQALITTAYGLGMAVAAIFPYNYFNARMDRARDLLELYATRLELLLAETGGVK